MKLIHKAVMAALLAALLQPVSASSAQESPRNEEEQKLDEAEGNVLQVQRELFAARQRGDSEAVQRLEKRFKKLQSERGRLLRSTWQL